MKNFINIKIIFQMKSFVKKTIIVTGSNQGIGRGIVEQLSTTSNYRIIMACRNLSAANKTFSQITQKYHNADINVEQLDLMNQISIKKFVETIKNKYKSIDILFNNAAVLLESKQEIADYQQNFRKTLLTNFYSQVELTENMIPMLNQKGKIINMSSRYGLFKIFGNYSEFDELKNINEDELSIDLVYKFLEKIKYNLPDPQKLNIPVKNQTIADVNYGISKLALNLYTRILSKRKDLLNKEIQVYCMNPGLIKTNMNHNGTNPISYGIQTATYLIQLPHKIDPYLHGKYLFQKKVQNY